MTNDAPGDARKQFDLLANAYERDRTRSASFRMQQQLALQSLEGPLGRVLEVGCGPGHMFDSLAPRARQIVGVDLSYEMLRKANARLQNNVCLAQSDACRLPFRDAVFDTVLCMGVLEYVRAEDLIRDISRVVRPGGHVVFTVPHAACKARAFGARLRRLARTLVRRRRSDLFARYEVKPLLRMLEVAGLVPHANAYCGVRVIPWPLDEAFPRVTTWINDRLERWRLIGGHPWFASVWYVAAYGRGPSADSPFESGSRSGARVP